MYTSMCKKSRKDEQKDSGIWSIFTAGPREASFFLPHTLAQETAHLKSISQIGSFPQIGMNII